MHDHATLTERSYLVTLKDVHHRVHQIQVNTACTCDMWSWVNSLPLPFSPDFMEIEELLDAVPGGVGSD